MKKYKILVVDDEPHFLNIMELQLVARGYAVATAGDGLDGFTTAVKQRPDLILADIMMPNIDGYELCKQIKIHPELKTIPVIFLTAKTDPRSLAQGYSVGGARYITKPFDTEELFKAIDLRLKDADKTRKLYANKAKKFCGELKVVSIFSLLDMFSLNRWYGSIDIERTLDQGRLEIRAGDIARCLLGGREQPDALMTVLGWTEGKFTAQRS
jgi:DNA-binding response OmpR family regulator